MNEIDNIKLKLCELNARSNEAFQEYKRNSIIIDKTKSLKEALLNAEESYKQ